MKMKHVWTKAAALMTVFTIMSAVSFAALPNDQVAIQGVGPGSTVSEMTAALGEPAATDYETATSAVYTYSNGLTITSCPWNTQKIFTVFSSSDANLQTPAGIHIGSSVADVEKAYGTADRIGTVDGISYYHYAMEPTDKTPDAFGGYSFGVINDTVVSIWAGVQAAAEDVEKHLSGELQDPVVTESEPTTTEPAGTDVDAISGAALPVESAEGTAASDARPAVSTTTSTPAVQGVELPEETAAPAEAKAADSTDTAEAAAGPANSTDKQA